MCHYDLYYYVIHLVAVYNVIHIVDVVSLSGVIYIHAT
jgi:hypothetical protein